MGKEKKMPNRVKNKFDFKLAYNKVLYWLTVGSNVNVKDHKSDDLRV